MRQAVWLLCPLMPPQAVSKQLPMSRTHESHFTDPETPLLEVALGLLPIENNSVTKMEMLVIT